MARKRTHKGSRNFVAIPVNTTITLGTLASGVVLAADLFQGNLTEDLYCMSADLQWSIRDLTAGDEPIAVGLAHSDYTVTEIKENIDGGLLGPGNKIEQEQARRLVRKAGVFMSPDPTSTGGDLNDGKPKRSKVKWMIDSGKTLNIWAQNLSGAALQTGSVVRVIGTVYGRWVY